MADIRNPSAVPVLAKRLRSDRGDYVFLASGEGLSSMGIPEATTALLTWAKQAPDAAAPLAEQWLGKVRDEGSLQLLREALATSTTAAFRSSLIKERLVEVVHKFDSRYSY